MAVAQVILGVVLLVLAACMMAAHEVLLTRANPGVRLPLWGRPSETPRTPTAAKVYIGLAVGSAIIGATSLDAASSDHIGWWWAVLVGAVLILPPILKRVSLHYLGRS